MNNDKDNAALLPTEHGAKKQAITKWMESRETYNTPFTSDFYAGWDAAKDFYTRTPPEPPADAVERAKAWLLKEGSSVKYYPQMDNGQYPRMLADYAAQEVSRSDAWREIDRAKARIVLLEEALIQSFHTISFLDQCTKGEATHAYPEQTQSRLTGIRELVDVSSGHCIHSRTEPDCSDCQDHERRFIAIAAAKEVLDESNDVPFTADSGQRGKDG